MRFRLSTLGLATLLIAACSSGPAATSPTAIDGSVNVVAVPPPSRVNFSEGVAVAVPTFCTTIVETPRREMFFAKYGA